jgi:hypothetical protein
MILDFLVLWHNQFPTSKITVFGRFSSMFFGRAPDAHIPTAQAIGVGLFATSPRSFLAVGFSLQSLTRAPTHFSALTTGLQNFKGFNYQFY